MHAIRQYEFGPAENLRYEAVDDPAPGAGQVRIAVASAGVHLVDTTIRSGTGGGPFAPAELPMTPGREVAGVVDAVGGGVPRSWIGRRVVGHLGTASGGYAELAVCTASSLHELPDSVADDVAVAMIGTGRTTMGILETAELTGNDVVLVTAAAGGIGSLLVQAARNVGAVVVGVAGGAAKAEQVRALGATVAVDYSTSDWPERVQQSLGDRKVTVSLDGVGGELGRGALELLGVGGRIVLFGYSTGTPTPISAEDLYAGGLSAAAAIGPRMLQRPGGIRELEDAALGAAGRGELVPLIGQTYPLARAAEAHTALENRSTTGKVVLKP